MLERGALLVCAMFHWLNYVLFLTALQFLASLEVFLS